VTLHAARNGDAEGTLRYLADTHLVGDGWEVVGSAFNAYTSAIDRELVPVYRFHAAPVGSKQLLSLDRFGPLKEGWKYDAIAFYAYLAPGEGRSPVFRLSYESDSYGYLERYTTSAIVRPGETNRGALFYVPVGTQTAPIYSNVVVNRDSGSTRRYWLADRYIERRWVADGIAFNALRAGVDTEAVPVRGFHVAGDYGYKQILRVGADAPVEADWNDDGVAFYAYRDARVGRVPVYRITYQSDTVGAMERYSTSSEVSTGETNAGVAFYTLP